MDKKEIKETESLNSKKCSKKAIIAIAAVIVVAVAAFGAWYFLGNSGAGGGSKAPEGNGQLDGNKAQLEQKVDINADTTEQLVSEEEAISGGVKQEFVEEFSGNAAGAVMTVNGEPVGAATYSMILNDRAMKYATSLMVTGALENVSKFDWNAKDANYDGSYLDYVKFSSINYLVPRYALVAEGKRRGVTLTEEDKQQVKDSIKEMKGDMTDEEFAEQLKAMGCPGEDVLVAFREFSFLESKVSEDFEKDPSKYASKETLSAVAASDMVTVKHILIAFDPDEG